MAASALGIDDLSIFKIKPTNVLTAANSTAPLLQLNCIYIKLHYIFVDSISGGSIASELNCQVIFLCQCRSVLA